MRPPFPPHQGGPGRPPQNPQLLMQQQILLQQQRVLRQQQQHQQNNGLNAAIRELQQRTQQNQRHHMRQPPTGPNTSQLHSMPPSQPPTHRSHHPIRNPSPSPGIVGQPQQLQLQINIPGLSPIGILRPSALLNQNIRGQSNKFLNPPPLGASALPPASIAPQINNGNFNNRTSSPLRGMNPLPLPDPPRDSPNFNGNNRVPSPDDRRRIPRASDNPDRRRDDGYRDANGRTVDRVSNRSTDRRSDAHNGRERDRYAPYSESRGVGRRSRSRSRERSRRDIDRSRSSTRDERNRPRRSDKDDYRGRERERTSNGIVGDKNSKQSTDQTSRERLDKSPADRKYGSSDCRERQRSSRRDERRSESVRSERSSRSSVMDRTDSRSIENGKDHRSKSSRRENGLSSSYPRRDRGPQSRSSSGNRRSTDDSISGLSQYRQDLLRAEFERELDEFLGNKRAQDSLLGEEKWDADLNEDNEEEEEDKIVYITRCCPADLYFSRNYDSGNMEASKKMVDLERKFEENIVKQSEKVRAAIPEGDLPPPPSQIPSIHNHLHCCHCNNDNKEGGANGTGAAASESSSEEEGELNDDDDEEDDDDPSSNHMINEWERRKNHPLCLHHELWFNEVGQVNDGPLCRCSIKSRKSGIRHDVYPGEGPVPRCIPTSNNLDRLHHYRVTMSPYTNFLTKTPTLIEYDSHEYIFEGFSLFTHIPLENIPPCKVLRFNIEYTIHFIPEFPPENFTVGSLDLFSDYLFREVLELLDLDWGVKEDGCRRFHFMPRFCRSLPDSGCKEVLSMNTVLNFLIKSSKPLVDEARAKQMMRQHDDSWRSGIGAVRGMIVTKPGMKPSSLRVDQLDRNITGSSPKSGDEILYPLIIHQGYRPAQLSYSGDPMYRRAWKQYVQFRHLLNSKPKIYPKDKQKLKELEDKLQDICYKNPMKREVTVELDSKGFLCTGLRADLCQHALMVPVLMSHLRFHLCLSVLEEQINYRFKDRTLLQLALTHTSYRTNFGTNPDHTRNSLTNCGMRQLEYGDRRVHYQNRRKRGICILLDIMSRFGRQEETISDVPHNERLEFLGDAVIEFLTSVHLFFMFPWLEEGGLSTYRMALVQNQHLTQLAKKLQLQDFMLYVHGPDLCHESDLRHAMANCCEALMGSLFLDGGMEVVDLIFSKTLFDDEDTLINTWIDIPKHVLQQAEPGGDRHWIKSVPVLQRLTSFEESVGVKFNHIRLLAKSFTHRNIGDNPLTMGHNQRLEFLGDTVLQLVASEYLYRHYPEHHEGHLSLLRSSLVNGRTQALVYDDLGMSKYVIYNEGALTDGLDMKTKQKADMLEAFIGALYVDKGLEYCWAFCNVCFFPRLKDFILNQDWNDPKSQLQQCCLTLREVGGGEPDIPVYKMIESIGPTNSRKYVVAVYFRGSRLATGTGHTIQQSEMDAASNALEERAELFPILKHQKRFLEKMKAGYLSKLEAEGDTSVNGGGQGDKESSGTGNGSNSRKKRRRNNQREKQRSEKMFTQKAESRLKEKDPPAATATVK